MGSPMLNFAMPFPIPRWRGTVGSMAAVHDVAADEARLAERAIAGDGNAFAELYGRYEKRAYNLCLRILGSEDEAADATQDAFVNVLRRLRSWRDASSPSAPTCSPRRGTPVTT